mmetsp:Transcript_26590/g.58513  ORF Transcript_26590/g.58513 Transcript_26590/m.58513 type:complete len:101 (-) Transcript_26590:465-767(-)
MESTNSQQEEKHQENQEAGNSFDTDESGCMLNSILIKKNILYSSNIGESETIIFKKDTSNIKWSLEHLSKVHTPGDKSEQMRILRSGLGEVHTVEGESRL